MINNAGIIVIISAVWVAIICYVALPTKGEAHEEYYFEENFTK